LYLFFMNLFFPVLASAVAPGFLDTTFNSPNGFATYLTPFMYGERPNGVALQSDGKIVVVDTTAENSGEAQIAVVRYNPDGSLDMTFNGSGRALYDKTFLSFATDVAIQEDGKIVVAGFQSPQARNWYDVILLRYNSDGTLDTSFNGGVVVFANRVGFDGVNTIASLTIQKDGKILVATHELVGADVKNLLLLRFDQNGSLDKGFGVDGAVRYAYFEYGDQDADDFISTDNIIGRRVKLTPDNSIAVLIQAHPCTVVLKYNQQGDSVSESVPFCGQLAPEGYLTGALPRGMEVQKDGKIVVVGEAGVAPFVLRYTVDGTLDTTFGEDSGVVYFNYKDHFGYPDNPVRSSSGRNVAIQQDGSILLVGSCPMDHDDGDTLSDDMDVFLARYTSDGTIDAGFGANGVVTFDGGWREGITYYGDLGQTVAVQEDGRIIVVANMRAQAEVSGIHYDMAIMRFVGQPGPDIDVSPVDYDYGEVPTGSVKVQQFNISNIGQSDLAVTNAEFIGNDSARFNIDPGTCQNLTPTIVPGGRCTITVRFDPGSEGLKMATLRITSNDPHARTVNYVPLDVSLRGTGVPSQSTYTLTVTTDGTGAGIVQSKPKGIKCGGNATDCSKLFSAGKGITLNYIVGQEESRFLGWSGACSAKKECRLVMDSNKEVKATFMADPTVVVCPKSKDFKDVRVGTMRAAFFKVKNDIKNGRKPLNIDKITLNDATQSFSLVKDECSNMTLQPRDYCVFGVVFDPEEAATYAAEVIIPSNDPASLTKVVPLSGRGLLPPPRPPKPHRRK
jgi:uncharacterized delta-60 repeat protein